MARGSILDVAAGASSFTAEANRGEFQVCAADPLYCLDSKTIYVYGKKEIKESTEKLSKIARTFKWDYYGTLEKHRQNRERSLELFIQSYSEDSKKQHYVEGKLPRLPFANNRFSLVLNSHFLFLYHQQFDFEFDLKALRELIRVCRPGGEVRIYPIIVLNRDPTHMDQLKAARKKVIRCGRIHRMTF